jgi:hypothetical protein
VLLLNSLQGGNEGAELHTHESFDGLSSPSSVSIARSCRCLRIFVGSNQMTLHGASLSSVRRAAISSLRAFCLALRDAMFMLGSAFGRGQQFLIPSGEARVLAYLPRYRRSPECIVQNQKLRMPCRGFRLATKVIR